ncbi:MAG: YbaB/EbfC family nucleoid-associated protein [Planctomycetaceae bacterium]|nr:YbaB/EbfC family nucleoid-associated protein [Planctomycetaceae bacterium]
MFKGLSNFAGMMKGLRDIQGRATEMKDRLAQLRVEGTAGGGMVVVEASGDQRLTACRIEPSLISSGDSEMLEDLVLSACNQALDKAREVAAEEMKGLTSGLDFPGLDDALNNLGLGNNLP